MKQDINQFTSSSSIMTCVELHFVDLVSEGELIAVSARKCVSDGDYYYSHRLFLFLRVFLCLSTATLMNVMNDEDMDTAHKDERGEPESCCEASICLRVSGTGNEFPNRNYFKVSSGPRRSSSEPSSPSSSRRAS